MKENIKEFKWKKFLRRARLFRFIPFLDFVLAAGSLATGNLHDNSDFDVIVGAAPGRIFTVRFFSAAIFGLFGWRRGKMPQKKSTADKICLNHFVTPKSYRLRPPHNSYWQYLYENLVPVLGEKEKINEFFHKNEWMSLRRNYNQFDERHILAGKPALAKFLEMSLSGRFGDFLEKRLKILQIKRIEKGLKSSLGYKPRIIYNDEEIEFHPDTKRIEEMVKSDL